MPSRPVPGCRFAVQLIPGASKMSRATTCLLVIFLVFLGGCIFSCTLHLHYHQAMDNNFLETNYGTDNEVPEREENVPGEHSGWTPWDSLEPWAH